MIRFTAWLSESEREAVGSLARQNGTSANYIVRVAVRAFLEMSATDRLNTLLRVTSVASVIKEDDRT